MFEKFRESMRFICHAVGLNARNHGYYTYEDNIMMKLQKGIELTSEEVSFIHRAFHAQKIMLEVSELAEAMEALRHNNPPSEHIPDFTGIEEEYADTVIRIMDTCYNQGYKLPEAILAKMEFNATREYMHGGKKF